MTMKKNEPIAVSATNKARQGRDRDKPTRTTKRKYDVSESEEYRAIGIKVSKEFSRQIKFVTVMEDKKQEELILEILIPEIKKRHKRHQKAMLEG